MIAFLPVARYRVEYQVASGRPFSSFERLLLVAIYQGNTSLDSLADLFKLHRRVVIEGIVTLMQAGWVCIGPDGSSFITTAGGRLACEKPGELPATTVVSNRSTTLLLEKVSGQLARGSDVDLYTKQRLDKLWTAGIPIPPSNVPNIVEPGMIAHLLPHEQGEWVRLVGPINVVTDNRLYAIVDVDTLTRKLTGIPQGWHAQLANELAEPILRAEKQLTDVVGRDEERELKGLVAEGAQSEADASRQTSWIAATLSPRDLLIEPEEHRNTLKAALASAQSYVAIVSSALSRAVVESIIPELCSALERDVLVSLFWCVSSEDAHQEHASALDLLKKIEYDSNHRRYVGRLVVNSRALGSSFNALISDPLDGVQVVFGSFSWLRSPSSSGERNLSISLRESPIGARFCDFIADLASKDERVRTSGAVTSLRKLAAQLRSAANSSSSPGASDAVKVEVNVFFDETLAWYVGQAVDEATESLFIAVDQTPGRVPAQLDRLWSTESGTPASITVCLGGPSEVTGLPIPMNNRIVQTHTPEMRANLVIWDGNSAVVTNRSWLAESQRTCRPYGSDVALAIRGTNIGGVLSRRLNNSA